MTNADCGIRTMDDGRWTLAARYSLLATGPWSLVPGPWSLVPGPYAWGNDSEEASRKRQEGGREELRAGPNTCIVDSHRQPPSQMKGLHAMPQLSLSFLGAFQVMLDGKPVTYFDSD